MRCGTCAPLSLIVLSLAAGAARAADFYVDPVHGDDANSGGSPADAWRRVTHALEVVPDPPYGEQHAVHLLPGAYAVTAGEVYPLPLRSGFAVVGEAGSSATLLEGGFRLTGLPHHVDFEARGLTLAGGDNGFYAVWHEPGSYSTELHLGDVVIRGMSERGIDVNAYGEPSDDARCTVELERVRVEDCELEGAWITAGSFDETGECYVMARDCAIVGCGRFGLRVGVSGEPGLGTTDLQRCRIVDNAGGGVRSDSYPPYSGMSVRAWDCLVAGNGDDGFQLTTSALGLRRSTVAHNLGAGVELSDTCFAALLQSSILHGNLDDLDDGFGGAVVSHCDIGDGDFAGSEGNISADPGFRDPSAADYRLGYHSRCIDRGDPADADGLPDLAGARRPIDGLLDTEERVDMGAFELAPLALVGEPRIGVTVQLECWGRAGGSARVLFAPAATIAPPVPTPFGELDLDRSVTLVLANGATAPGPPALLDVPIPDDASLVGATWSFQSLSTGLSLAPDRALTNAVSFTVLP